MAKSKIPNTVRALLLTVLCTASTIKCDGFQHYQHKQSTSQEDAPYPQPWEQPPISESSSSSSSSSSLHSSLPNHAISLSTYYHTSSSSSSSSRAGEEALTEPVLCLLRGISIEQTRNQSRNFYECPGRWPAEFVECCDGNQCCAPNYVRQYLQEKVSEFEKLIVIFCLSFLFVFILYLLCFFIPCCPLKSLCRAKKSRDYAGCTTKMTTEGPQYQTMAQECPPLAMMGGSTIGNSTTTAALLNHHRGGGGGGGMMYVTSGSGPTVHTTSNEHHFNNNNSNNCPSGHRVAIAETTLMLEGGGGSCCLDEPSSASNSSSSNGGGGVGSHIVTIHHTNSSSRGSSPTTDTSLLSLVHTGANNGMVSAAAAAGIGNAAGQMISSGNGSNNNHSSTFSRPPVKSILKLNHCSNQSSFYSGNGGGGAGAGGNVMQMHFANGHAAAPATIKPFGYRDPRNSIVSCTSLLDNGSAGGLVATAAAGGSRFGPIWPDHQHQHQQML